MIELEDVAYVRLGSPDIESAETFATRCLGLQVSERAGKSLYLRSDARSHTLCYFEGDPAVQIVGFEVKDEQSLESAAVALDGLGHSVHIGSPQEAEERKVKAFIGFRDPTGNHVELVVRPERSGRRYFPTRDAGITGFSHVGLHSKDPVRDEKFWCEVLSARASDRLGNTPLMRFNEVHHSIALINTGRSGIQHINHQVQTNDDVLRSYYFLKEQRVPIFLGPGRHPTSGARFLYFRGPDDMIFEYSTGVMLIEDEVGYRPRQFNFEPDSMCMWGSVRHLQM